MTTRSPPPQGFRNKLQEVNKNSQSKLPLLSPSR